MSVVSEAYAILFLFFAHVGSIDLLIDKQEFVRNKVLKVNSLCGNDIMDVSVGRQFEGEIFGFRKFSELSIAQVDYQAKPKAIGRFSRLARQVENAISSGVYYPNESYMCGNCGYQGMCEKW